MAEDNQPLSSDDMIRRARESLMSDKPEIEVPELETEIEVEVDFDSIAQREREREPEIETGPVRRPQRRSRIDRTIPTQAPHERPPSRRGVMVAVLIWIVLLGIGLAVFAATIEGP